jgi:hypothetical protein
MFISPTKTIAQEVRAKDPITSEGASFREPKGWVRLPLAKGKTRGYFISGDSDRLAPKAMMMVDIGKPTVATALATAEGLAKDWGGRVLDEKTTLDGVEAVRVRVEKPGPGLRPNEAVIAMKDGKIYLLMGGSTPGTSISAEVEEVRAGWKWVK